jgi:hypothetical protein
MYLMSSLTHLKRALQRTRACARTQGKLREALQLVVDTSTALDNLRGKVEIKSAALNNHFGIVRSSGARADSAFIVAR